MSQTIIDEARARGDLMAMFDFRGGNLKDQSRYNAVLTTPANAELSTGGLHVDDNSPATFPLDMSGTQNFCAFFKLNNALGAHSAYGAPAVAEVATLTATGDSEGGWIIYVYGASDNQVKVYARYYGTGLSSYTLTRSDVSIDSGSIFVSCHFDRRLSYSGIKNYSNGVALDSEVIDQNTNDGTTFANDTIYLMRHNRGKLQVFGIIDMTSHQLSATQQALLYSQIRDKLTI